MKRLRPLLLSMLVVSTGCDFAAIAYLMGKDDGHDDDGGPVVAAGSGNSLFQVWVASIPDDAVANSELAALVASNGVPSSTWTEVGNVSATTEFGLGNPSSINSILMLTSGDQNYYIDSVEILGSQDEVLEYASGTTWSGRVDFPDRMLGAPDGSPAVTNAAGSERSFIFTRYLGSIQRFRINGQRVSQPPAPGDTTGTGSISSPGDESPGGAAADPSLVDGLINIPINLAGSIYLARFDSNAQQVDEVQVASGVTAAEGGESAAVDADGTIYVASTVGNGQVQVRRFASSLAADWTVTFSSGLGGDRVESNGLAVDPDGNIVVSGGRNALLTGVSHWMARLSPGGAVMWERSQDDDVSGPTYWRGVTTDGGGQIYSSGDLNPALVGGANQVRTARISALGDPQWSDEYAESGSSSNLGRAVAIKSSGEIIVGGYVGTTNQGRNGLLLRYSSSGSVSSVAVHNGPAGGDDEILDVAVDADGSVFAAGYETVAGQGENLWIRKYASNGSVAWTRTYDGGFGNDRGVSLALSGSKVFVAGTRTNAAGQRKFMLRAYAK